MTMLQPSDLREFVQYVITAVNANPDLREPLLRALLTEDFLQMPVRLARLDDVPERLARLDDVPERLARVEDDVKTLKDDMGQVKGMSLEGDFSHRASSILNREFGLVRNRVMLGKTGALPDNAEYFMEQVEDAQEQQVITAEQAQRLLATDVIVRCRRLGETGTTWVAIEVAARVDENDVNRVIRSADALRTLFGEEVLPVVVGERIDPPDADRAERAGVKFIKFPA